MAKTEQSKQEAESIIRWDETGDSAILWTASATTRREWESWGIPMRVDSGGWRGECPTSQICYKLLKKSSKSDR